MSDTMTSKRRPFPSQRLQTACAGQSHRHVEVPVEVQAESLRHEQLVVDEKHTRAFS